MSASVPVRFDASELREALEEAREIPFGKLVDELAEGVIAFKDRLRGDGAVPGDPWPIGTVKRSARGNLYYVEPGTPGSRRSGRSLRGWKTRQKGLAAVVFNDAKSPRTKTYYAEHIHLSGGGSGDAVAEAEVIFLEEMEQVAERMTEHLEMGLV